MLNRLGGIGQSNAFLIALKITIEIYLHLHNFYRSGQSCSNMLQVKLGDEITTMHSFGSQIKEPRGNSPEL